MENGLLSWSDFPPIYLKIAVRIFYGVIDLTKCCMHAHSSHPTTLSAPIGLKVTYNEGLWYFLTPNPQCSTIEALFNNLMSYQRI